MEEILYMLRVLAVFQGCIAGVLLAILVVLALRYKDLI